MKVALRQEEHTSYKLHRRQLWTQILLPMIAAVLVFMAVITLMSVATFRQNGDVGRWAAISTIWLVIPVMIIGLVLLVVLAGLVFLAARLTHLIPPYSYRAQGFAFRVEAVIMRITAMIRRPALLLGELGTFVRAAVRQARERM